MVHPIHVVETSLYSVLKWLFAAVFQLYVVVAVLYAVLFSIICYDLPDICSKTLLYSVVKWLYTVVLLPYDVVSVLLCFFLIIYAMV